MRFSLRGIHATARFHHAFWRHGSDVATRGPRAATGEDEADRYCFPGDQSQRHKRERQTVYRAFFEELGRLGHVEGQNLGVERYSGDWLYRSGCDVDGGN